MALLRVALRARTITSDETALRRDLHSHSQSSSSTRLRGRRIIGPMNSEWKVSCSACGMVVPHHRGHAAVVVDRSIRYATGLLGTPLPLARYGPNSATAVAPERHRTRWRVGLSPDASESASKSEVPESTILYQATILLRTRVSVDAVETPGPRRGSRSVPGGTTRAPGGTRRGTIHGTACCLSCLMSTCRAARVRSSVLSCQLTQYLACQPFRC